MKTFNLNKFQKQAFYDDGRGLVQKQTRAMMNCWKAKMDAGKMGAQEAYMSCLEEYQKSKTNDWGTKYATAHKPLKKAQNALPEERNLVLRRYNMDADVWVYYGGIKDGIPLGANAETAIRMTKGEGIQKLKELKEMGWDYDLVKADTV